MNVNTKEMGLLKDMKGQEQLCIEKYNAYANEACSRELRDLFRGIAEQDRKHLQTVTDMMGGELKNADTTATTVSKGSGCCCSKASYDSEDCKKKDAFYCADMLTTEKHVSALYNTSIFEFSDAKARDVLNHIQTEKQQHGLQLYDYMSANGMYQ